MHFKKTRDLPTTNSEISQIWRSDQYRVFVSIAENGEFKLHIRRSDDYPLLPEIGIEYGCKGEPENLSIFSSSSKCLTVEDYHTYLKYQVLGLEGARAIRNLFLEPMKDRTFDPNKSDLWYRFSAVEERGAFVKNTTTGEYECLFTSEIGSPGLVRRRGMERAEHCNNIKEIYDTSDVIAKYRNSEIFYTPWEEIPE